MKEKVIRHCKEERKWSQYLALWGIATIIAGFLLLLTDNLFFQGIAYTLLLLGILHLITAAIEFRIYQSILSFPEDSESWSEQLEKEMKKIKQRSLLDSGVFFSGLFVMISGTLLNWNKFTIGIGLAISISIVFSLLWWTFRQWRLGIALGIDN